MAQKISDIQLHALIDGQLDHQEAEEVYSEIQADPELRARFEGFREQKAEISGLLNDLAEPGNGATDLIVHRLEKRLLMRRLTSRLKLAAAVLVVFIVGFSSHQVWQLTEGQKDDDSAQELLAEAAQIHGMVIASKGELNQFLIANPSRAVGIVQHYLGRQIALPDVDRERLSPVGAMVVPVRRGAGIEMVYTDYEKHLITLFVTSANASPGGFESLPDDSVRNATIHGVSLAYWRHGEFAYTIAGEVPPDLLNVMAKAMFRVAPSKSIPF